MKILITGGAGFIGSALIRQLLADSPHEVVNLDKLTYAGHLESLRDAEDHPRYSFLQADVSNAEALRQAFEQHSPDAVMHLAAESHVDRSIHGPDEFLKTNVVGTYTLLQAAVKHRQQLPAARAERFRFLHVSTDEVYGDRENELPAREDAAFAPSSPYSASKAAADHLVRAWQRTYGLPTLIAHGANTYGPYQFPEKLIPLTILNVIEGLPVPVYGSGEQVRDWLHVDDHVRALRLILERGEVGERYNIAAGNPRRNIDLVRELCRLLDEHRPAGSPHSRLIRHVEDRPGHDGRYAIDAAKLRRDLGWAPQENFETGLQQTVAWYLENAAWWARFRRQGQLRRDDAGSP